MTRAESYRRALANSPDFNRAKVKAMQLLLKSARWYIQQYAAREFIVDFGDQVLVEPQHREFVQYVVDTTGRYIDAISAAESSEALLAAYDGFAEWIAW
jgi:hypothetical protein